MYGNVRTLQYKHVSGDVGKKYKIIRRHWNSKMKLIQRTSNKYREVNTLLRMESQ